jgi:hypothetical protein
MTATILSYIVMGIGAGFCVAGAVGAAIVGRASNKNSKAEERITERSIDVQPQGEVAQLKKRKEEHFVISQVGEEELQLAKIAYEQALEQHKIIHEQAARETEQAIQQYREALAQLKRERVNLLPIVTLDPENEETPTIRASNVAALTATFPKEVAHYAKIVAGTDTVNRKADSSVHSGRRGGSLDYAAPAY